MYSFADKIDIPVLDELQAKHVKEESIELNLLSGLDDLEEDINKLEILSSTQKSSFIAKIEKLVQLLY